MLHIGKPQPLPQSLGIFADPPARFEAGTPHIVGAIGLHAAVNWVEKLGLDAIHAHECALVAETAHSIDPASILR